MKQPSLIFTPESALIELESSLPLPPLPGVRA